MKIAKTLQLRWDSARQLVVLILALIIIGAMSAMRLLYPDLMLIGEVPLLIVCFALLQWFLLNRLKRHYTTADLV